MPKDEFRYDILAQEALRGVVRTVLRRVEKRGLPGDHHFVITFDTTAPGVSLSKRLLDRYPQEMTIVIQYQFWGLKIYENAFEIGLSFNNVPETLVVPFRAMRSFQDPSVGFMLQFGGAEIAGESAARDEAETEIAPGEDTPASTGSKLPSPAKPALPTPSEPALAEAGGPEGAGGAATKDEADKDGAKHAETDAGEQTKGAEVVHLDAFRKK